jgi:hypothetical protein
VDNKVEFEPDPHQTGNKQTIASVTTDPLPSGGPPSSVDPITDFLPKASPLSTDVTSMANSAASPEVTLGYPQSPVFQSPEHFSPLLTSSPPRDVGDQHTPEGQDSPRMGHSPRAPSKFDRVDREPELPKEVSPQVSRSNPRGNQRPLPRDFPGLHVDPALPSTLQENLPLTKTDRLIQVSTRGLYRANARGEQPLTERTLVETLIVMHEHITAIENDAMRERAARVLADECLRNSELLVRFPQSEAEARETQGVKRPRDERDP